MLFAITWTPAGAPSEERDSRTLKLFTNWQPPSGFEFKGFYDYADGNGGLAIVETSSAETVLEALAPWAAFFSFTARPIVDSQKAVSIYEKGLAWRSSVR